MSKTAIVTGAAGAIGSVVAARFAETDWHLALLDYGSDHAATLRAQHPDALVFDVDLTDAAATREVFREIDKQQPSLDAVLNIAGGFAMQPVAEASEDDLAHMHRLNFHTLFNTTRAALPIMMEQESGFLMGVAAAAALDGAAGASLYAATKASVAAYLKSLHAEVRDAGLRASVLYPMGVVDTPANREAMPGADPETWISRSEIADHMYHLASIGRRGHVRELQVFAPGIA